MLPQGPGTSLTHEHVFGAVCECAYRSAGILFSDLRHGWVLVEREHYRQPLSKVCLQQFLYENGTQLCSYLVCRFVFDQGLGTSKEFDQINLLRMF